MREVIVVSFRPRVGCFVDTSHRRYYGTSVEYSGDSQKSRMHSTTTIVAMYRWQIPRPLSFRCARFVYYTRWTPLNKMTAWKHCERRKSWLSWTRCFRMSLGSINQLRQTTSSLVCACLRTTARMTSTTTTSKHFRVSLFHRFYWPARFI